MTDSLKRVYAVILLASVLSAAWIAYCRLAAEQENNTVGIIVDFYAMRDLSLQANRSISETLEALKASGVWGIGLEELTVSRAASEGLLMLFNGLEAGPALQAMGLGVLPIRESSVYVVWWPATTPQWFAHALRMHVWPWAREVAYDQGLLVWEIPAGDSGQGHANRAVVAANVGNVGLGLSETAIRYIRQAGLQVVPRFRHASTLNDQQVRWRLRTLDAAFYDAVPVVFAGQRIPGAPDLLAEWISGLQRRGLPMGVIEFSPQPGDRELAQALGNRGIRVHSINPQELLGIDPQVAVERWRRAVRERNVRMLYVRPLPTENPYVQPADNERISPEVMLFQKNVDYVWRIAEAVRLDGFYIGRPAPFRPLVYPWVLLCFSAAGIALGGWLLLSRAVHVEQRHGPWLALAAAAIFAIGYLLGYGAVLQKVFAWMAAVIFPTLAVVRAQSVARTRFGLPKGYWSAAAVSMFGALHVVAMLADVRYMIKTDQFVGVKLAHAVPPALIVLGILLGPLPVVFKRGGTGWQRIQNLLAAQVSVKALIGAAAIGSLALVYLLRTGHEYLPVFALENTVRRSLEALFVVRPRTKEIFFGHPLLVAALHQQSLGRRRVGAWLSVGAVIGQLSVLNTFSHIHTSLIVSLWRTLLGLLLGYVLGWVVAKPVVAWFVPRIVGRKRGEAGV